MLSNLREPTTIYVLIPRAILNFNLTELKNFYENCQHQSTKLDVKDFSPYKYFKDYEDLVQRFPDRLSGRVATRGSFMDRGILIVYGPLPTDQAKKVPHAFVPISRLVEEQPVSSRDEGAKGVVLFKGESEVMNELNFLAQDSKRRKVYILQGDGELDINEKETKMRRDLRVPLEPLGCATLVERLKKDQFDVQGLTFLGQLPKDKTENLVFAKETGPEKRKEVPEDADAVLIPGPSVPLGAATEALERFMDRGGRLLVYLDIVLDSKTNKLKSASLEEFLRKYGVLVGKDFAMRVPQEPGDDPRVVIATVPKDSTLELAKAFADKPMALNTVRIVRPDPAAQKYKVEPILQLDSTDRTLRELYWEENDVQALTNPIPFFNELARKGVLQTRLSAVPIPIAVAVSEKQLDPASGKESFKPRLVVFGDAEMVSNAEILRSQFQGGDLCYAWTISALEWLAANKSALIGPRAKAASSYSINPLTVDVQRVRYLPGWLMMLSILSLGAGIWVVRRR